MNKKAIKVVNDEFVKIIDSAKFKNGEARLKQSVYNKAMKNINAAFIVPIRIALADYMRSEGCSCCENTGAHKLATEKLAKLLDVPMYKDKSGYDFHKFMIKEKNNEKYLASNILL